MRWAGLAVLLVVLVLAPRWLGRDLTTALLFTFLLVVLACNYDLVGGYLGLYNLGQASFFGLGAYTTFLLLRVPGLSSLGSGGAALAVLAGGLVAAGSAALVAYPLLRLREASFAVGSFGLLLFLRVLVDNLPGVTGGSHGLYVAAGHYLFLGTAYGLLLALAAGSVALNWLVERSRMGLAMLAIRESEAAAAAVGINRFRVQQMAFVLGALPTGLAGGGVRTPYGLHRCFGGVGDRAQLAAGDRCDAGGNWFLVGSGGRLGDAAGHRRGSEELPTVARAFPCGVRPRADADRVADAPGHRSAPGAWARAGKGSRAGSPGGSGGGGFMKPPTFDYYDPATLEEALELMERYGSEAKVLAGGQSLMPLLNLRLARPSVLVDLNRIPGMDGVGREDGWLRVGALARQWDVEHAPEVVRHLPVLRETLRFVAHPQIRMRGTVGGSIAHADPAAELPAVLVCLDGEVVAYRRGGMRIIAARELFVTYLTTSLEPTEILTEVRWPILPAGTGCAFVELARRHGDYALVGVAALLRLAPDGSVVEGRIALAGCGPVPVRAREAEKTLLGARPSEELWEEVGRQAASAVDPPSDLHASSAYRRHVAAVLVARALQLACDRARGEEEG